MRPPTNSYNPRDRIPVAVPLVIIAVGLAVLVYMVGTIVRHRDFRTLDATVRYVGVEGGCWLLETPDQRFNVQLDPSFQVNGAQVTAVVEPLPDAISICQIGPMARVERITFKRDAGPPNNRLEPQRHK